MFIIHTKTGKYQIRMRGAYLHITSEKKLRELILKAISQYADKPGYKGYAESLKKSYDENDLFKILDVFGWLNYRKLISR